MFDRLTRGELDAAFCLLNDDPPSHLTITQLGADEIVAVFSTDQAPPTRTVALSELASLHLIGIRRGSALTSALEQRLEAAGLHLRLALESGDPFLLRSLAARGFAVAILPRSITSLEGPPVGVRSLRPRIELPVVLAWRKSDDRSPAARAFVDFVLDATR